MMQDRTKTIFATSSGHGRAGIAVVRISGPQAGQALKQLAGGLPPARRLSLRRLKAPDGDESLDHALVVWLPGPDSYTGEDMAELHLHGGLAVVDGVLRALGQLHGLVAAEPGMFTRRAFDNGRMGLVEVEGLADIIAAETQAQRAQALGQMDGALGALYEGWREGLLSALAYIEAVLDFPDEEDTPAAIGREQNHALRRVLQQIGKHLNDGGRGERLREGVCVVIAGAPNVGKSSLLNRLAQRDVAIVSTVAGTTRDVIEVHLDLDGVPVNLVDTAGIHEAADEIGREGVLRARAQADKADILLWLLEPGDVAGQEKNPIAGVDSEPVYVTNKIDLVKTGQKPGQQSALPGAACSISAKTGQGMDGLISLLTHKVRRLIGTKGGLVLTRARHRQALEECAAHLRRALDHDGSAEELKAEDIRLGVRALGRITGRVDVEAVLDRLFAEFCIGK